MESEQGETLIRFIDENKWELHMACKIFNYRFNTDHTPEQLSALYEEARSAAAQKRLISPD